MQNENRAEYPRFSVLMSLYMKEKPEYFDQSMRSVIDQTVKPDEIVIILDGPITEQLNDVLETYIRRYPELITVKRNQENKGLGLALADGVPLCRNELIARMDTDDIARRDRFEKQLDCFMKHESLDVCGSHIQEFDGDVGNVLSVRRVPLTHDEIARYQKRRSALNHMTVMYKKQSVLDAGNYEHCPLMEDDMLWVRMLMNGAKAMNIDDCLVYARTGSAMIARRGGWPYFLKYCAGRKKIYQVGYISRMDYVVTIAVQLVVAMIPERLRLWVFTRLLRKW